MRLLTRLGGLKETRASIGTVIKDRQHEIGMAAAEAAKEVLYDWARKHKETGSMADSVARTSVVDYGQGRFKVGLDGRTMDGKKAMWIAGGTEPHDFGPKNAPYLTFFWKREKRWFTKGLIVHHPGIETPDNPTEKMENAARAAVKRLYP